MMLALMIICVVIFILIGYRFTPLSAAKAHSFVTKDDELIGQYKDDSSIFYLFKNDKEQQYRTVYVQKRLFIYVGNTSTYISYTDDPIQTIGGMSIDNKLNSATLLIVRSLDENISSIIIETENHTEKKPVPDDGIVHFLVPYSKPLAQLYPIALNKSDEPIYYFGYEKNYSKEVDSHVILANLKWHKIKNNNKDNQLNLE
jgi:hypothetical protein